jgi:RNA polymerase sigma-70 factor (ECF subfamily)
MIEASLDWAGAPRKNSAAPIHAKVSTHTIVQWISLVGSGLIASAFAKHNASLLAIKQAKKMRGHTMSTLTNYERNDAATLGASVITTEEAALLASARTGDSTAFECLVMPHWDALLSVTQRILRNREDAEDAVQTAFLDAFRNLNAFHGRSRFSSWLTRIAMNAAFLRLRVSRRKRETPLDEVTETGEARTRRHLVETRLNPEQEYLSKENRVLLEKALKKLRPLYVEVLHLHSVQELSAKETARMLELPLGTVKARLYRARTKLARHVQLVVTRRSSRGSIRNDRVGGIAPGDTL